MAFRASDSAPAPFDKLNKTLFNRRTPQTHAAHLLPHIKKHHRILDIGCGPGSITIGLAKLVPDGEVIGIDINPDSIHTAQSAAEGKGVTNVSFTVADVPQDLSKFEVESFDIIHAHQVLLHLPDPLKVLQEMRRLVKPGGILSTRDCVRRIIIPTVPGIERNLETFYTFSRSRGADPDFGQRHHIVAHEAGFEWDDIEMSVWSSEESAGNKAAYAEGAKAASLKAFVDAGLISEEERDEQSKAWSQWAELPEARALMIDSALICRKR